MKTAQEWLAELSAGTSQAFPNILRSEMVSGLRERLAAPERISQSNTSLCGPASLMYSLASVKPDLYARYVAELYLTGRSTIGRLTVKPGTDCRAYAARALRGIHPVDWVALASLRDSENDFLDYDAPSDAAGGITMPGDLLDWFKDVGFSKDANFTNLVFTKDVGCLSAAGNRRRQNHSVCLFVHSNMLENPSEDSWSPDHWVVLVSPVAIKNGRASFTVFSWGSLRQVNEKTSTLCDNFYGYISASP